MFYNTYITRLIEFCSNCIDVPDSRPKKIFMNVAINKIFPRYLNTIIVFALCFIHGIRI